MLETCENSAAPGHPRATADPLEKASGKYGSEGLLPASADRGWSGPSAERRNHSRAVIAGNDFQSDVEICVDLIGNPSLVIRRAAGIEDRRGASRVTIWRSPPGWREGSLEIAGDPEGILHFYLPLSRFFPSNPGASFDAPGISALSYARAFEDPLLAGIAHAIASELRAQTAISNLRVEALAGSLAARLSQRHSSGSSGRFFPRLGRGGLDKRRLFRVLDYINANMEGDLTIDRMASIACLSRNHFARAFKQAVGQSPHRYVSAQRLEHAKALLTQSDRPLVEIALSAGFSCQANFTRAFRQATGQAPGQFRRGRGSANRTRH